MSGPNKAESLPQAPVDFAIVTALEEEREAVLSALHDYVVLDKDDGDIHTYYWAQIQSQRKDRSRYHVIVTCLINMGPITATAQTVAVVNRWRPRYVLLVGITCGIPGEASHGDVIVASQVADYTLGKQIKGKRQVRWSVFPCGASLLDSANNVRGNWHELIPIERPGTGQPMRHKGVVASGGDVIQDDRIIATYSESWPKLVGIEMESAGVAAGIYQTAERPEFLMIKGVSDFGKDKHEPTVKPWREYSCHSAAAFTISLIKSGPSRSLTEIEETSPSGDAESSEARRTAEREWAYIQQHKLVKLKIFFLLKEDVGQQWFRSCLQETLLRFERGRMSDEGKTFRLSEVLAATNTFNRPDKHRGGPKAAFSFWQVYKDVPGQWCKIISREERPMERVAGFEAEIPWAMLDTKEIETLQDLAQLSQLGISLPISVFEIGVEEFEMQFMGDTFWFRVSLSEDGILGPLHEVCQMQHTVIHETEKRMPIGTGFSGVKLLDMFLREFLQQRSVLPRPDRKSFPMGFCGPGGEEIHFYPDAPKDFSHSPEMDKYSFKVSMDKRDWASDIETAEQAVKASPSDVSNYLLLARLYWAQGRKRHALNCLKRAIEQGHSNGDVYDFMGALLGDLGRTSEAIEYLRGAVVLKPDSPTAHNRLGLALSESGNYPEAIKHFAKVVELDPNDPSARHNLGLAMAKNGQLEEALPNFQHAADSGNVHALRIVAAFVAQSRGHIEARPYLERAVQLDPRDAGAWSELGSNFAICKELEKAVECYRQALSVDDHNPRTHEFLAATLADLGRWDEAESPMRRALELAPNDPQINRNMVAVLANLGRLEEAIEMQRHAIELDPSILEHAEDSTDSSSPGTRGGEARMSSDHREIQET